MPAQFTKHFVQDLTQDIKIRQCGTIVFNKDNESNVISVDLYNGQEEYSGGGSVAGACICPDGSTVPLTGSISGKTASVTLTGDCFAFPGQIGIGIQVVNGTVKTTVLKAIYNVELFETDDVVDPGSRITASVGDLVQDIADAIATIPADLTDLLAAIAPTFSDATPYKAGQFVWYDGKLYRFSTDHAAGTWASSSNPDYVVISTGDCITDAQWAIGAFASSNQAVTTWERGNINGTTGQNSTSTQARRARTRDAITLNGQSIVTDGAVEFVVFFYNGGVATNNYLGSSGPDYRRSCNVLELAKSNQETENADRFRLTARKIGNGFVGDGSTADDIKNISDHLFILNQYVDNAEMDAKCDNTLTVSGDFADAKTVGDRFSTVGDRLTDDEGKLTDTILSNSDMTKVLRLTTGGIKNSGAVETTNTRIRTGNNDTYPIAQHGDFYWISDDYIADVAVYSGRAITTANFIAFIATGANGIIRVPDAYIGKYIAVSLTKIGYEESDISGDLEGEHPVIYDNVKYGMATDATLTMTGYAADAKSAGDKLTEVSELMQYSFGEVTLKLTKGKINDNGSPESNNVSFVRSLYDSVTTPMISKDDYYKVDYPYSARVGVYSANVVSSTNFVGWASENFSTGIIKIPETIIKNNTPVSTAGCYAAICVQRIGYEEANIQDDIMQEAPESQETGHAPYLYIYDYVKYYRPSQPKLTDGDWPVYVALGPSSTQGEVHYYTESVNNGHYTSYNNYPDYLGKVLHMNAYNLGLGSTGLLKRGDRGYTGYGDPDVKPNICDTILQNDALLKKAKLITLQTAYGNDFDVRTTTDSARKVFPVGQYTDYYDYEVAKANLPTYATAQGIVDMVDDGATVMGCLNWCIHYINTKYPYARLIVIFGAPSVNEARPITINASATGTTGATKTITFRDEYAEAAESETDSINKGVYLLEQELKKLEQAMNICIVDTLYDGNAISNYSMFANNPNSDNPHDYALFGTTRDSNGNLIWNSHPNDIGYLYYARFLSAKIASLFWH